MAMNLAGVCGSPTEAVTLTLSPWEAERSAPFGPPPPSNEPERWGTVTYLQAGGGHIPCRMGHFLKYKHIPAYRCWPGIQVELGILCFYLLNLASPYP